MKRFLIVLSNLSAWPLLVICLAMCVLWVRSELACDVVRQVDAAGVYSAFCSAAGYLQFTRTGFSSQLMMNPLANTAMAPGGMVTGPATQSWRWVASPPAQTPFSLLAPGPGEAAVDARVVVLIARSYPVLFPGGSSGGSSGFQTQWPAATAVILSIAVPYWFLAALSGIVPLARGVGWYARWRRRRRVEGNVCTQCGYDLRATPGRCPECGKIPQVIRSL